MVGHQQVEQAALFYGFSLERHVPANHLLRSIDRFVELSELRRELSAFYSTIGRPSIAPELMIRMLLVGYCFGIRSERRLCEEVHLNLAEEGEIETLAKAFTLFATIQPASVRSS
jgi:transposase